MAEKTRKTYIIEKDFDKFIFQLTEEQEKFLLMLLDENIIENAEETYFLKP